MSAFMFVVAILFREWVTLQHWRQKFSGAEQGAAAGAEPATTSSATCTAATVQPSRYVCEGVSAVWVLYPSEAGDVLSCCTVAAVSLQEACQAACWEPTVSCGLSDRV